MYVEYVNPSSSLRLSAECLGLSLNSQKKRLDPQLQKKSRFVESAKNEIQVAVGEGPDCQKAEKQKSKA